MDLINVKISDPPHFRGTKKELTDILRRLPITLEGCDPEGEFRVDAHKGLGKIIYLSPQAGSWITRATFGEEVTVDEQMSKADKHTTLYFEGQRFEIYYGYRPRYIPEGTTVR